MTGAGTVQAKQRERDEYKRTLQRAERERKVAASKAAALRNNAAKNTGTAANAGTGAAVDDTATLSWATFTASAEVANQTYFSQLESDVRCVEGAFPGIAARAPRALSLAGGAECGIQAPMVVSEARA